MKQHNEMKILWRGWHLSPLFVVGKYTAHFTSGITFGKSYNCASITYYVGWMILSKKTKYHHDFIRRVNNGTWPKDKLWIVKYGRKLK